jgi:hypothetical protein
MDFRRPEGFTAAGAELFLLPLGLAPRAVADVLRGVVEQVVNLKPAVFKAVQEPAVEQRLGELAGFAGPVRGKFHIRFVPDDRVPMLVTHRPEAFEVSQNVRHRLLELMD